MAVAYSGGLDSSVLLSLARDYAAAHRISLFAFHINHGISMNASRWLEHCAGKCVAQDIVFDAREVQLAGSDKTGIEEAARNSRYAALGELCRKHNVPLLLTAHHQDDQAETVLLQLLRGSGIAGLSAMEALNTAPALLGDPHLLIARPLLAFSRSQLEFIASTRGIEFIEDESNADPSFARNALRHHVMPALATCFPGFEKRLARTAGHAQSAQRLLDEFAALDLAHCLNEERIDLRRLRLLSDDRIDNMLRHWISSRGVRMPSTAWLREMRMQLFKAKEDAQVCIKHPDCEIRRHRGHAFLIDRRIEAAEEMLPIGFRWNGQSKMAFPQFQGTLYFDEAEEGIDALWLAEQTLRIRYRSGGERLKPASNRPTRSLKQHYQALDIPAWERERLPVVDIGDRLVFAAGIGMDCHLFGDSDVRRIRLRWQHMKA
ncbi:tRNA lysidine(34) synthetase TilS [Noviherbaspirillum sp.]|uniref:tRNA lysidine(34) synthetase TilS n=1 Tax=Noviherbaspirillum sp. TaxID=1926288 RepID=UPI002FE1F45B